MSIGVCQGSDPNLALIPSPKASNRTIELAGKGFEKLKVSNDCAPEPL